MMLSFFGQKAYFQGRNCWVLGRVTCIFSKDVSMIFYNYNQIASIVLVFQHILNYHKWSTTSSATHVGTWYRSLAPCINTQSRTHLRYILITGCLKKNDIADCINGYDECTWAHLLLPVKQLLPQHVSLWPVEKTTATTLWSIEDFLDDLTTSRKKPKTTWLSYAFLGLHDSWFISYHILSSQHSLESWASTTSNSSG